MTTNKAVEVGAMIEIPVEVLGENYKDLLTELTVLNPKYSSAQRHGGGFGVSKKIPQYLYFYVLNNQNRTVSVPRNFKNLPKYLTNFSLLDVTEKGERIPECVNIKLRKNQEEYFAGLILPYINTINNNRINKDLLLNAPCGAGKTVMALYLANIYLVKTVVAVTTINIGKQFINTVKDLFPNWTVGFYDSAKGKTFDITIATYATLSNQPSSFYQPFGHIILDEYHRCGADTYSAILERAGCWYRTSLTATPRRKDGLYDILKLHAGEEQVMERDTTQADIYPVLTGFSLNEDEFRAVGKFPIRDPQKMIFKDFAVRNRDGKDRSIIDRGTFRAYNKQTDEVSFFSSKHKKDITYKLSDHNFHSLTTLSFTGIDTEISLYPQRDDMVIELLSKCIKQGRRIIVLSKRKEQLFSLHKRLKRRGIDADIVVSHSDADYKAHLNKLGVKHSEYVDKVYNESRIILGINKLAEEGMDVPKFDTLIYLHIIKDVEQSIGRILRIQPGKKTPVAFCFIDDVSVYRNMFFGKNGCENMFKELGHNMQSPLIGMDGIKNLNI